MNTKKTIVDKTVKEIKKGEKEFIKQRRALDDQLKELSSKKMTFKDFVKKYDIKSEIYDIEDEYVHNISSQVLKDIGYEDTERGRDYVYQIIKFTNENNNLKRK